MIFIRDAVVADLPIIMDIYNYAVVHLTATFDIKEVTLSERKEWFQKHGKKYPVIVAEIDGEVVGFGSLSPFNKKAAYAGTVEISIYTSHRHQGKSIGKSLMGEMIERANQNEFRAIIALITSGNEGSIQLHKKFGFTFAGRLKQVGYKFDRWLDVEYYQLLL